jgi:hypothetical protein
MATMNDSVSVSIIVSSVATESTFTKQKDTSMLLWEPPTVNIGALKRAVFHQRWKPLTTNTLALKRAVCSSVVTATPMQALANQRS